MLRATTVKEISKLYRGNRVKIVRIPINQEETKKRRREIIMATQIATTPILYGEEAMQVIREASIIPSEKARENGRKLVNYFKKFTKEGR